MAGSHGKIESLLNILKQLHHLAAMRNVQLQALQPPRPCERRYNALDVRIRQACDAIVPEVAQMAEHVRHMRLARHCRHMAFLLGGAVHDELQSRVVPVNENELDDEPPDDEAAGVLPGGVDSNEADFVALMNIVADRPFDELDPAEEAE